jgi:Holliday junction resolvasome RuvABC endonuclease subunit
VTKAKPPKGLTQFATQVQRHREAVLGHLVVFDPATGATSGTGWAEYREGKLLRSGVITPDRTQGIALRLRELQSEVVRLGLTNPDACVIERLRGSMVHPHLHWAAGVLIAAANPGVCIEIPIPVWRALAAQDPEYTKGDEADALAFGASTLRVVRSLEPWPSPGKVPGRRGANRGRTK